VLGTTYERDEISREIGRSDKASALSRSHRRSESGGLIARNFYSVVSRYRSVNESGCLIDDDASPDDFR
jgi:hypothetical protein